MKTSLTPPRESDSEGKTAQIKVAPDSMRVSYFYKALKFRDRASYRKTLGDLFIPAWTQLTAPLGLTAYLPAVPPPSDASPQIPDEIAIVFFESQEVYNAMTKTTGGRLCGATLHSSVFAWKEDPSPLRKSSSGFPRRMPDENEGQLEFHQNGNTGYYLFDNPADWHFGTTEVFVGARPKSITHVDYTHTVQRTFSTLRKQRPSSLEGLLFVILEDCLIYWTNWSSKEVGQSALLAELKNEFATILDKTAVARTVPPSLSESFEGVDEILDGDFLSIRFRRRRD